jgi:hypothetical protein
MILKRAYLTLLLSAPVLWASDHFYWPIIQLLSAIVVIASAFTIFVCFVVLVDDLYEKHGQSANMWRIWLENKPDRKVETTGKSGHWARKLPPDHRM